MSISSSLNAGVMGLTVNAARLATISNNIANSATYGYKRAEADFSSMVLQQRRNAYAAGGVRVDTTKLVNERGALVSTGSATDLAVGGEGLLPVTNVAGISQSAGARDLMFTPTGAFTADQNGFLRTPGGLFLLGWPADGSGNIDEVSRRSGSDLEPVNVNISKLSAEPTTQIKLGVNLPASRTEAGASSDPLTLPIEYYDNLGKTRTLRATFTPVPAAAGATATNEWKINFSDEGVTPAAAVGEITVKFNDTAKNGGSIASVTSTGGATYDSATGEVKVTLSNGPVKIAIGSPGESNGLTQLSAKFSPDNVTKNGAPIGDLKTIEVNRKGVMEAVYDTGFRRAIYQVPVGSVPNLNGLTAVDSQAYTISQDSGDFFLWDAGDGPAGEVVGFSLMESATDVGTELTDLIKTQRAYASNAKIIQTVDEMLQETTNIVR